MSDHPTHIPVAVAQELSDRLKLNGVLIIGLVPGSILTTTWGRAPKDKHQVVDLAARIKAAIFPEDAAHVIHEDFRDADQAALSADKLRRDNLALRDTLVESLRQLGGFGITESNLSKEEGHDLLSQLAQEVDNDCGGSELDASDVLEPDAMLVEILKLSPERRQSAVKRVIAKRPTEGGQPA